MQFRSGQPTQESDQPHHSCNGRFIGAVHSGGDKNLGLFGEVLVFSAEKADFDDRHAAVLFSALRHAVDFVALVGVVDLKDFVHFLEAVQRFEHVPAS